MVRVSTVAPWFQRPPIPCLHHSAGDSVADDELVRRVVDGDRKAAVDLVHRLTPCIQRRVAKVLSRGAGCCREDVVDYTQDILLRLFEQDHRILRAWDPARGASLATFVGLVAEREVIGALRSGRRTAWREDRPYDEILEPASPGVSAADRAESRDVLSRLIGRMQCELTVRSRDLFHALFVQEQRPDEVAQSFGMSLNALYSWRSRFKAQATQWLAVEA